MKKQQPLKGNESFTREVKIMNHDLYLRVNNSKALVFRYCGNIQRNK